MNIAFAAHTPVLRFAHNARLLTRHPSVSALRTPKRNSWTATTPNPAATSAQSAIHTSSQPSVSSSKNSSNTNNDYAPVRWRVRAVHDAADSIIGRTLVVKGWVRTVRDQKQFAFVDVNDGSSLAGLQVVVDANTSAFASVSLLTTGCSIAATGEIISSPGKGQSVEMKATQLRILGECDETYPLQKKRHSLEYLRSIAHLRPRTNTIGAVARVRSALALSTHDYFSKNGFVYLHAPIITASDCEGAGEMFRVTTAISGTELVSDIPTTDDERVNFKKDFFDQPTFLTVSGQLSGEAYASAMSDVYTFGPTFRAENSNTSRHLSEFWMIEPEMAFASLEDAMGNAEGFVKHVVSHAMDECAADLRFFDKFIQKGLLEKLQVVRDKPFGRITYTEAIELLKKANKPNKRGRKRFEFPVEWGYDLQSEHERYLAEEHFKGPVFVYNYPKAIKAFYMRDNDGEETVQAMDLLVPGIGELIGGSAREERLRVLTEKIEKNGLDPKSYWWYLDLRRYGSVPHAGYGLGFERLVQLVTGVDNVRDTIPFPRYPHSAEF